VSIPAQEYDLKKALASGETKKISAPTTTPTTTPTTFPPPITPTTTGQGIPAISESTPVITPASISAKPAPVVASVEEKIDKPVESISQKDALLFTSQKILVYLKNYLLKVKNKTPAGSIKFAAQAGVVKASPPLPVTLVVSNKQQRVGQRLAGQLLVDQPL
jgi:hypothetical protein